LDIYGLASGGVSYEVNPRHEIAREEKLMNLVGDHRDLSAAQLSQKIVEDVQSFSTGDEPCDDITLVIIKRAGEAGSSLPRRNRV
jgi:serine phosphatase RsbU (regulator of sigma subunit)